jgi:ATP-dependent exoDNAse (exonuclease V) beta subunit
MKHFQQNPIQPKNLERIDDPSGRVYKTPAGTFPSITTVLSRLSRDSIKEWRKRVGEEEANRITQSAADRGTKLHKICEDYLSNKTVESLTLLEDMRFKKVKGWLDENVGEVIGLELPLYSSYLGVAGTCDCIITLKANGKLFILDFKTSRKSKERWMVESYFLQATGYCVMFEEVYGLPISRFGIIMLTDDGDLQTFYGKRDNYIEKLVECIEEYKYEQKLFAGARGGTRAAK